MTSENATSVDSEPSCLDAYRIAVLVPCYNEERSIARVIADFRTALPNAAILVYDNNSTDKTASVARKAGAEVFFEKRQGKGFVVRRMLADVEADIYVLVDGDATYDAPSVRQMISQMLEKRLDMVVGARTGSEQAAYRAGHRIGNKLFTAFVSTLFRSQLKDMLSGYRILSRRFVKSFPVLSGRFEVETELTIHALELALAIEEVDTPYYPRAKGSFSKLKTWSDGFRILLTISNLLRAERPLPFFACIGSALAITSLVLATPIFLTFIETGLVPRLPTAVLSTGLMLLAFLSAAVGLILDTVTRGRRELKLLAYLSHGPCWSAHQQDIQPRISHRTDFGRPGPEIW